MPDPIPDAAPTAPPSARPARRPWDLFCRVIDNYGDIGVCWRLAADLAGRGVPVRLWVDDPAALRWMAPAGHPGVRVARWDADTAWPEPGEVVVEAFGCDPPEAFVAAMDHQREAGRPPVWINLEYLSAENYVERSHRLPSPQWRAPAQGLVKWFFYPGFTPATGGLLREPGLRERLAEAPLPWPTLGVPAGPDERRVSLFCYPHAPLQALPQALAPLVADGVPVRLLLTPGAVAQAWEAAWGGRTLPAGLRVSTLPWLDQTGYDALLAACDLNLVRGEDSFVRAQWAGRPFLWHIYAQDDGVHAEKLEAFLQRQRAACPTEAHPVADAVATAQRAWNGLAPACALRLPDLAGWTAQARHWRDTLTQQDDLVTQLLNFVAQRG